MSRAVGCIDTVHDVTSTARLPTRSDRMHSAVQRKRAAPRNHRETKAQRRRWTSTRTRRTALSSTPLPHQPPPRLACKVVDRKVDEIERGEEGPFLALLDIDLAFSSVCWVWWRSGVWGGCADMHMSTASYLQQALRKGQAFLDSLAPEQCHCRQSMTKANELRGASAPQ